MSDVADEVIARIRRGELDSYLSSIRKEVDDRSENIREFIEFVAGDRVVINEYCSPKYLRGEKATVTGEKGKRLLIRLDRSIGRFSSESNVTIPPRLLDKIWSTEDEFSTP